MIEQPGGANGSAPARTRHLALAIATIAGAAACTGPDQAATPTPATTPPASPSVSTSADGARPPHPVSLEALMQRRFDGDGFRIVRTVARTGDYTSHEIRYSGGGLRLSGLMLLPRGSGPFPVLVLNHGYIDPAVYTTGRGFERSQPYLARAGFAVVHIDYRNHAASDDDPANDLRLRLGYVEDAINAVRAIERSGHPRLDAERIGMLGRSMGGGVTYGALVVDPDLVDAAAIFASVSTDTVDNFRKWIRPRRELANRIVQRFGSPVSAPGFWRGVSPRTYLDRITAPLLVHHGTADETCPIAWTEETVERLRAADADVTYHRYPGEGHQLYEDFDLAMRRTVRFFRSHLRSD